MKKLSSIIVLMGMLCSLTAFTVGCGEPAKKSPSPTAGAATTPAKTTTTAPTTN